MIIIRPIEFEDIENRGFLEVLENLVPSGVDKKGAKQILQEIKSNPLHKIDIRCTRRRRTRRRQQKENIRNNYATYRTKVYQ